MAVGKRDDRLLHVLLPAAYAAKGLGLAFAKEGVDRGHLHVEKLLDGRLDLRLRRVARHLEDDLIVFGRNRRLLRNHGSDDRVVMAGVLDHLNRASNASIAALVSTSFSRRTMSYTLA